MKDKLTGPPLGKTAETWGAYPKKDLYNWIRNSQKMIASGHPRATEIWNEYKPTVMTNFPNLTDAQIDNILAYIDGVYAGTFGAPKATDAKAGAAGATTTKSSNLPFYAFLLGVLVILSLVLAKLVTNLNFLANQKEGKPAKKLTFSELLTSRSVIALLVFFLVVLGGYTTVNNAISLGRQQGYQPEQPIKFSHETHAGVNKIDCQYCHDGARRSKHSIIPAANTCMNCHSAVKKGSKYGTAEISKIYASIGFNPIDGKYIENYDKLSEKEIEEIYKKWISTSYLEDKGLAALDEAGTQLVEKQWKGIKTSLTNDLKKKIQGPIEWVRIHGLPDHVYFNHSQHVAVGKVACQTCHGPVEKMEKVYQYSPLSMGWCVNCHRETEVKGFKDNPYYQNLYKDYHDKLKSGKMDKVTVEQIGGLECQKCHY